MVQAWGSRPLCAGEAPCLQIRRRRLGPGHPAAASRPRADTALAAATSTAGVTAPSVATATGAHTAAGCESESGVAGVMATSCSWVSSYCCQVYAIC